MNLPEEKRVRESISKHIWITLTGPAAGSLKDAFFGPSVTVLQKSMEEKGGKDTQAEGEKCTTNEAGRGEMTPSDTPRTTENIKPETEGPIMIFMAGTTAGARKYIKVQQIYRIVLLGDTRAGKSSLANSMFGEDVFRADNTECQAESKSVHGRRITLINTPDFFSPGRSEEELKPEILRCITEFPPGPHAFLIMLKVEKSAKQQQQAVIQKICQYFSEKAFKYAAVVFTQDDQVSEGMRIQEFIAKNKCVSDLVKKCKSRFHIINKCKQQGDNISNQSQVAGLLNTIKQIVEKNKGRCYTSKMLPQGDTCNKPNISGLWGGSIKLTGPAAESVAKAFSGPAVVVLTQGTINEAEESSKTTDKKGQIEEETASETVGEMGKESQEKTEGKEDDRDGIIHEAEQDQHPKETEEKAEDRSQKSATEEKILGPRQAAGGAEPAVAAGVIAAAGVTAAAGGAAAAIGTGVTAAAGGAATAGVTAATEIATAAGYVAKATGPAAGVVSERVGGAAGYVATATLATGGAMGVGWVMQKIIKVIKLVKWIMSAKQHLGVVLLVLVFYSLVLSWFFLKVSYFGTLLLLFLLLLLVIILVVT